MGYQNLQLLQIRQRALGMLDSSDNDNHFGTLVNGWINDGLQEMAAVGEGIEDTWQETTTIGQRNYVLPVGFIKPKLVLYNGNPVEQRQLITQDFFSTGNSDIDRFALWYGGGGQLQILLGPQPPSHAYVLLVYYVREPLLLVNDTDVPDVPNRFRHYLSNYAAAQMLMADGNIQDAQVQMQQFQAGVLMYREWSLYRSRQNFQSVLAEVDY